VVIGLNGFPSTSLYETPFASDISVDDYAFRVNKDLGNFIEGKYAGDWNSDGYADLLMLKSTAPWDLMAFGVATCPCSGTVNLSELSVRIYLDGDVSSEGLPAERAGDLNGDGFDDIVVDTYGVHPVTADRAYVVSGGQEGAVYVSDAPFFLGDANGGILAGHDYDGDDALDVLLFDGVNNKLSLYSSLDMPF